MLDCLGHAALRDFRYGRLEDDAESDAIAEHLASCGVCQQRFGEIPDQPLVQWLFRCAHSPELTPAGQDNPDHVAWDGAQPPPALLAHPKWQCLRLLGKGGMGAAYLARQRQFPDRQRAIKILQPQHNASEHLAERFRREILVTLDQLPPHDNIVRGYDAEVLESYLLLVVEYVPGENLERLAARQPDGRLEHPQACGYLLQALAGLAHAARHGVIHRDLKPSNLMLSSSGTIKILDFGLAKVFSDTDSGLTSSQVEFCGTAKYCSPEQASNFARADERSDLYSLGCTLYRLIAGVPPFGEHTGHTSALSVFQAHAIDVPKPLVEHCPNLPPELSAVVAKLLAKDPADRYPSASEAMASLLPFADAATQEKYAAHASPQRPEVFDASRKKPAQKPWPSAIVVAAVLLLAVFVAWRTGWMSVADNPPPKPPAPIEDPATEPASDPETPPEASVVRTNGGKWRLDGPDLVVASSGEELLLFGGPHWTDYTFTCDIQRDSGDDGVSLAFRADDNRGYLYTLGANHNQSRALELFERRQSVTVLQSVPDEECLKPGWRSVKVEVTGSRAKCYLDDIKKFDFEGVTFEHGRVGLRVQGATARFRHLLVKSSDGKTLWSGLPELPEGGPQPGEAVQQPAPMSSPPTVSDDVPTTTTDSPVGVLVIDDDAPPQWFGMGSWSDYDFSCQVQLQEKTSDVQFFVRAADDENAVLITLGALGNSRQQIEVLSDGRGSQTKSAAGTLSSAWHDVAIKVRGEQVRCQVDDLTVLELAQSQRTSGKVGLAVGRGRASFRNLKVKSPSGETLWEKK